MASDAERSDDGATPEQRELFDLLDTIVWSSAGTFHVPRYDPIDDEIAPLCGSAEPDTGWKEKTTAMFPGRAASLCDRCVESWVMAGKPPVDSSRMPLTTPQMNALLTAYEMGYFDVPRDVTQREVADELGISHQAFSERLRRGCDRLVRSMLIKDAGGSHNGIKE